MAGCLALAWVAVLAAGCSSDDESEAPATTSSSTTEASLPPITRNTLPLPTTSIPEDSEEFCARFGDLAEALEGSEESDLDGVKQSIAHLVEVTASLQEVAPPAMEEQIDRLATAMAEVAELIEGATTAEEAQAVAAENETLFQEAADASQAMLLDGTIHCSGYSEETPAGEADDTADDGG